jgi:hypothetical protein
MSTFSVTNGYYRTGRFRAKPISALRSPGHCRPLSLPAMAAQRRLLAKTFGVTLAKAEHRSPPLLVFQLTQRKLRLKKDGAGKKDLRQRTKEFALR